MIKTTDHYVRDAFNALVGKNEEPNDINEKDMVDKIRAQLEIDLPNRPADYVWINGLLDLLAQMIYDTGMALDADLASDVQACFSGLIEPRE